MTGEPTHTASEMTPHTPAISYYCVKIEVSITLCCQLCSTCHTAFRITYCLKSTSANGAVPLSYINYFLKREVSIMLRCWICSTCYTAVQIKNCSKSTSAITTMKNTDVLHYKGKPSCTTTKATLFTVNKDKWDTKEDTGKSMKNALYVLQYVKRHLSGQSDIKQ